MTMQDLKEIIKKASKDLFGADVEPELTRPDEQFGDYATNIALQLAGKLNKNPRQIAEQLSTTVIGLTSHIKKAEVAGAGFINITLTDKALAEAAAKALEIPKSNSGKEILAEFGDPNPFKEMHIGHLYSAIVGDSISGILEASGAKIRRLSYHGDVGLHIAKAIFGLRELKNERDSRGKSLDSVPVDKRPAFLSIAYAFGAKKYEEDSIAKNEIEEINLHVYKQDNPEVNELHKKGSELSFSYFDQLFHELGIKYDKNGRYLESTATDFGLQFVNKYLGKVFEESQGAIIYRGEKAGLHTRVFITSKGLPTYETKDLGLAELKNRDYPDTSCSIIITASEQTEYFKVMLAALAEIDPELAKKTIHLSHGFLSLTTGKMSSRTGNVYSAADLLKAVEAAVDKLYPDSKIKKDVYIGAVKYALLKHRLGQDIVVDPKEAASLQGNSGPYLQYAHARARGILQRTKASHLSPLTSHLEPGERSLARKVSEYPEVIEKSVNELMPHHVCTYLYELAQVFNRFYENNRVIGDPRELLRVNLVQLYADVLKNGLGILNIPAPERM